MAKKSATQEDFDALVEEVGRLEADLLRMVHFNRCMVHGLNAAWTVLDRLTGRRPDILKEPHVHEFKKVRPAVLNSREGYTIAEGVTEACACGAVRSRATNWSAFEVYKG